MGPGEGPWVVWVGGVGLNPGRWRWDEATA